MDLHGNLGHSTAAQVRARSLQFVCLRAPSSKARQPAGPHVEAAERIFFYRLDMLPWPHAQDQRPAISGSHPFLSHAFPLQIMMGTFIISFIGNSFVESASQAGPLSFLGKAKSRKAMVILYFSLILAIVTMCEWLRLMMMLGWAGEEAGQGWRCLGKTGLFVPPVVWIASSTSQSCAHAIS